MAERKQAELVAVTLDETFTEYLSARGDLRRYCQGLWIGGAWLGGFLPIFLVLLYALRRQIEEAFRDLKSTRFGLSLELHHTYQLERLQVLLLIAALALMVAWIIGKATQHTGQHRHYQANTVPDRVVLSTIFLGLKVIDDPRVSLRFADVIAAINSLYETLQKHCQDGLR